MRQAQYEFRFRNNKKKLTDERLTNKASLPRITRNRQENHQGPARMIPAQQTAHIVTENS